MAGITTDKTVERLAEGVAVMGSAFGGAGRDLFTGQAAEAARKQVADLTASRTKGYGGTYGIFGVGEEAKVADSGWAASQAALRSAWPTIVGGLAFAALLPAESLVTGRTEMRGKYLTGCWEVTCEEMLEPAQRDELEAALLAAGYAMICSGAEAADKVWRWAVPASYLGRGKLLAALYAGGVKQIGMFDRAHDFSLMPVDLRGTGADAKTRPPDQVALMFDITDEQAAAVEVDGRKVFQVSAPGVIEATFPLDLVGTTLVPNDAEHGRLTFFVRGISDPADGKQDGPARLQVAAWLGVPQSWLEMRAQNGTLQETFRCDAALAPGQGGREMKAMIRAAQVLGDCGQQTVVGDYSLWVHAGRYRLELAAEKFDVASYAYFQREEQVRAEKRAADSVSMVRDKFEEQLGRMQAADAAWRERVETAVVTQGEETKRVRAALEAEATKADAARVASLKELETKITAERAAADVQRAADMATQAAALAEERAQQTAALAAERAKSEAQLAAMMEVAREDRHAAASQGVLTVHSLLQLMRPSSSPQVAVPALIQQLEHFGPILTAREEYARPAPLPPPPVEEPPPVEDAAMPPVALAGKRSHEEAEESAGLAGLDGSADPIEGAGAEGAMGGAAPALAAEDLDDGLWYVRHQYGAGAAVVGGVDGWGCPSGTPVVPQMMLPDPVGGVLDILTCVDGGGTQRMREGRVEMRGWRGFDLRLRGGGSGGGVGDLRSPILGGRGRHARRFWAGWGCVTLLALSGVELYFRYLEQGGGGSVGGSTPRQLYLRRRMEAWPLGGGTRGGPGRWWEGSGASPPFRHESHGAECIWEVSYGAAERHVFRAARQLDVTETLSGGCREGWRWDYEDARGIVIAEGRWRNHEDARGIVIAEWRWRSRRRKGRLNSSRARQARDGADDDDRHVVDRGGWDGERSADAD